MSLEDAYMFPVFGSMTLFGLYLVFRYVDKTYVNYLLTAYFGLLGVMATTQVGVNCVAPIVKLVGINVDKWHLTLTKKKKGTFSQDCRFWFSPLCSFRYLFFCSCYFFPVVGINLDPHTKFIIIITQNRALRRQVHNPPPDHDGPLSAPLGLLRSNQELDCL